MTMQENVDVDVAKHLPYVQIDIPQEDYAVIREYIEKKYDGNLDQIAQNRMSEIINAFKMGVKLLIDSLDTTSSTSLILDGRRIRRDESDKLGLIALVLENQECYPKFKSSILREVIRTLTLGHDFRTSEKYLQRIQNNSIKDQNSGIYDVSTFCNQIPKGLKDKHRNSFSPIFSS